MTRQLRVAVPGTWHFVIARGSTEDNFCAEAYYQKFVRLLATLPERFGVRLHSYVLIGQSKSTATYTGSCRYPNVSYPQSCDGPKIVTECVRQPA
jgi:hypothetical protein